MGGTFNPPHMGHVTVAQTALKRLGLSKLWWLVTPGNPLKSRDGLSPTSSRMAAAQSLARDRRMVMTAFEDELGSPYTAQTLSFLRTRYPTTRFVWVMGADNLATFHRWQHWQGIAHTMPFVVIDRPGWRLKALASPAARALSKHRVPEERAALLTRSSAPCWAFLSTRLSELSSTELRRDGL